MLIGDKTQKYLYDRAGLSLLGLVSLFTVSCADQEILVATLLNEDTTQTCKNGSVNIEGQCIEDKQKGSCPKNDPQIESSIQALGANHSLLLPSRGAPPGVGWNTQMYWRSANCTALYAGSYTGIPALISQKVWSYHLGSNRWEVLFNGNSDLEKQKSAVDLLRETFKSPRSLSAEEQRTLLKFKKWWLEEVVFKDGHFTMQNGGPVMPRMVYDGMTFNNNFDELIWGSGASLASHFLVQIQAWANEKTIAEIEKQTDQAFTKLWSFSPSDKKWRQLKSDSVSRPRLEPTSGSMISSEEKIRWFGARDPFEMWTYNLKERTWKEDEFIKKKDIVAVNSVQSIRISTNRLLYINTKTSMYNEQTKIWSQLPAPPTPANSSNTLLMFSAKRNKVLLFSPNAEPFLSTFDLESQTWSTPLPDGPPLITGRFGKYYGYFDASFDVAVIHSDKSSSVWVYRPE